MNNIALVTIIILFLIIVTLLGIIFYLLFHIFRSNKETTEKKINNGTSDFSDKYFENSNSSELNSTVEGMKSTNLNEIKCCIIHKGIDSAGQCSICNEYFCEGCLKDNDGQIFCTEHYQLYKSNKWIIAKTIKTNAETPEAGIVLYNIKKSTWENDKIPSYIITDYKINTDSDLIESYVSLYIKKDNLEYFRRKFQ